MKWTELGWAESCAGNGNGARVARMEAVQYIARRVGALLIIRVLER